MCRKVKTLSICPTCSECISENSNQQWCKDARRKNHFGRCTMGIRRSEEEFRGDECKGCADVRETQMSQLEMSDFAMKRLGWRTSSKGSSRGGGDDSDDGFSYVW